jgi:hypothetical protein
MNQTKCINLKYLSREYKNLKEWMEDPNNVYIGRKEVVFIDGKRFPEEDSIWINPFRQTKLNNKEFIINEYRKYIVDYIKNHNLEGELLKLKNKNLGYWTKPEESHGSVLIELINNL